MLVTESIYTLYTDVSDIRGNMMKYNWSVKPIKMTFVDNDQGFITSDQSLIR